MRNGLIRHCEPRRGEAITRDCFVASLLAMTLMILVASCARVDYNSVLVARVVDGDTLKLASGERVRLIGIDTPEMRVSQKLYRDARRTTRDIKTIITLGKKSYRFTKELVEGKSVRLEFDVERYDKYNRLLAYVYLADGTFVNAEIVKQGYANLMTIPPNVRYADLFLKLYQEARENNRGLWKEEGG